MSDQGHRLKIERFFDCFSRRDFDGCGKWCTTTSCRNGLNPESGPAA